MADTSELQRALARAIAAKDAEAVQVISAELSNQEKQGTFGAGYGKPLTPIDALPPDPTEGMSGPRKFMAGVGRSMTEMGRGVAQLVPGGYSVNDYVEDKRLDAPLMATGAGKAGGFVGDVATAFMPGAALNVAGRATRLPMLARGGAELAMPNSFEAGLASGAVAGGMQPTERIDQRFINAGVGATFGGAVQAAPRLLAGDIRPEAQALVNEGVAPTVGQMRGGWLGRIEEGLQSVPLVGDIVKGARRGAVEDFNRAIVNRALAPVGVTVPANLTGRDAIAFANTTLSNEYQRLLPNLRGTIDQPFIADLQAVSQRLAALPAERRNQIASFIQEQIGRRFRNSPTIGGRDLKDAESEIARVAANYRSGASADEREMGNILSDLQDSFRGMVARSNPQESQRLAEINQGWALFKRAQKAAASAAVKDGTFTPAQFNSAVRSMDRSKDKAAYARGDAMMQDISENGRAVLGDTLPDSGTPFRVATMAGLTGGGAYLDPMLGLGVGLGAAAYTTPGRRALAALATQRPDILRRAGRAGVQALPYVTLPAVQGLEATRNR